MNEKDRIELFDRWANGYDEAVRSGEAFPFAGYDRVLDAVLQMAAPEPGMSVLDVGVGTGTLAGRFLSADCTVWGPDASKKMLAAARRKLPQIHFIQANLLSDPLPDVPIEFARIVSAYVFHEFDLENKIRLVKNLMDRYLARDGWLVLGDISFSTVSHRE